MAKKSILKNPSLGNGSPSLQSRLTPVGMKLKSEDAINPTSTASHMFKRNSRNPYGELLKPIAPRDDRPRLTKSTVRSRLQEKIKSPREMSLLSQIRSTRRRSSSTLRSRPRILPGLDRQTLEKVKAENVRLEAEIADLERRTADLEPSNTTW